VDQAYVSALEVQKFCFLLVHSGATCTSVLPVYWPAKLHVGDEALPQPLLWPPRKVSLGGTYITQQLKDLVGALIDWSNIPAENQMDILEDIKVCPKEMLYCMNLVLAWLWSGCFVI
jgi:hypothetical protein